MATVNLYIDGVEVTADVVYKDAHFRSLVNGQPGECSFRVRDLTSTYSFTDGADVLLLIDGEAAWRGYLTKVKRVYIAPALNIGETGLQRWWDLEGVDLNILFKRRYVFNQSDPESGLAPLLPPNTEDTTAHDFLFDGWIDLSGDDIDVTSEVENVGLVTIDQDGRAWQGGDPWQSAEMSIAAIPGAIFYIRPEVGSPRGTFVYTDVDTPDAPFGLSDQPSAGSGGGGSEEPVITTDDFDRTEFFTWGTGNLGTWTSLNSGFGDRSVSSDKARISYASFGALWASFQSQGVTLVSDALDSSYWQAMTKFTWPSTSGGGSVSQEDFYLQVVDDTGSAQYIRAGVDAKTSEAYASWSSNTSDGSTRVSITGTFVGDAYLKFYYDTETKTLSMKYWESTEPDWLAVVSGDDIAFGATSLLAVTPTIVKNGGTQPAFGWAIDFVTFEYEVGGPTPPVDASKGYREMEILGDGSSLINDAFVWGFGFGSSVPVFKRLQDEDSLALHGRWQAGSNHPGIYKKTFVDRIANSIVYGSPENKRGHKDNKVSVQFVTFEPGLLAGQKVDFTSEVFGYQDVVPVRQLDITFESPTAPKFTVLLSFDIDAPFDFYQIPGLPKLPPVPPICPNPPCWPPPPPPPPPPPGCPCGDFDDFERFNAIDDNPHPDDQSIQSRVPATWGVSLDGHEWTRFFGSFNYWSWDFTDGRGVARVVNNSLVFDSTISLYVEPNGADPWLQSSSVMTIRFMLDHLPSIDPEEPDELKFFTFGIGTGIPPVFDTPIGSINFDAANGLSIRAGSGDYVNLGAAFASLWYIAKFDIADLKGKVWLESDVEPDWQAVTGGTISPGVAMYLRFAYWDTWSHPDDLLDPENHYDDLIIDYISFNCDTSVTLDDFERFTAPDEWGDASSGIATWTPIDGGAGDSAVADGFGTLHVDTSGGGSNVAETTLAPVPVYLQPLLGGDGFDLYVVFKISAVGSTGESSDDLVFQAYGSTVSATVSVSPDLGTGGIGLAGGSFAFGDFIDWVPDTLFGMRWQQQYQAGTARAKVWDLSGAEPDWMVSRDSTGDSSTGSSGDLTIEGQLNSDLTDLTYSIGLIANGSSTGCVSPGNPGGAPGGQGFAPLTRVSATVYSAPAAYQPGSSKVFRDGLLQVSGTDYIENPIDGTVTFTSDVPDTSTVSGTFFFVQTAPAGVVDIDPSIDHTGATDVTSQLEAAIAAAAAAQQQLRLYPLGFYRCNDQISLTDLTNINVDMNGSTIRTYVNLPGVRFEGCRNVTWLNGTMHGDGIHGVYILGDEDAHAFHVGGGANFTFIGVRAVDYQGDGWYFSRRFATTNAGDTASLSGCTSDGCGRMGIAPVDWFNLSVTGHTYHDIGFRPIDVEPDWSAFGATHCVNVAFNSGTISGTIRTDIGGPTIGTSWLYIGTPYTNPGPGYSQPIISGVTVGYHDINTTSPTPHTSVSIDLRDYFASDITIKSNRSAQTWGQGLQGNRVHTLVMTNNAIPSALSPWAAYSLCDNVTDQNNG